MKKKNFTMLELLIVVAVIAILMSLLLPSLRNAKRVSMFAVCKSNQSQIYIALNLYNSNYSQLPYGENPINRKVSSWEIRLAPYMKVYYPEAFIASNNPTAPLNNKVLLCPEDPSTDVPRGFPRSYGLNNFRYWRYPNTKFGVISRRFSRTFAQLKSGTMLILEKHQEQLYKFQGMSFLSGMSTEEVYDDMETAHMRNWYNFTFEDGHVVGAIKARLHENNKKWIQGID